MAQAKQSKGTTFIVTDNLGESKEWTMKLAHPKELVIFFRSEDQADGKPCEGITTTTLQDEAHTPWKKTELDNGYTQEFGFDLFRPDLYGKNKGIANANSENGKTIESYYIADPTVLSYKLTDSENNVRYVNDKFKLVKRDPAYTDKYYLPNILVLKGKTIRIYARFFCTGSRKKVQATINASANTGLKSITQNVSFERNENTQPIEIVTDPNAYITKEIIISINVVNSQGQQETIGKCRLLPNKEAKAKAVFIDADYNSAPVPGNYNTVLNNLNTHAFNQAGIQLVAGNNHTLELQPGDQDPDKGIPASTLINGTSIVDLHGMLNICCYKFYETFAEKLMKKIEAALKQVNVTVGGNQVPLIKNSEKIGNILDADPIKSQNKYTKLKEKFITYLKEGSYGVYPIFIFSKYTSGDKKGDAMGFIGARGIISPANVAADTMALAHELGHNFNLGHTFISDKKENLDVPKWHTRENIMDYVVTGDAKRLNFITFQWEIMRKAFGNNKTDVADLLIQVDKTPGKEKIVDVNNNSQLTNLADNLLDYLCDNIRDNYKVSYDKTKIQNAEFIIILEQIKICIIDILNLL